MYYNKKFDKQFESHVLTIHKKNNKMLCERRELYLQRNRIMEEFIREHKDEIIIHGSRALNFYKKIYDNEKIIGVDYDLMSPNSKRLVIALMKFLKNKKISGITHKYREDTVTYIVKWHGHDFTDIRSIDQLFFDVRPYKEDSDGLKYLNYDILKMNLYKQSVISEQFRWTKVYFQYKDYENMNLMYSKVEQLKEKEKVQMGNVVEKLIKEYVSGNKEIIVMGNLAYSNYKTLRYMPPITYIDVGTYDVFKEIEKMKKIIGDDIVVTKFNNVIEGYPIYAIALKGKDVAYIHEITMCVSVKTWGQNYYVDVFKLFTYYVMIQYMHKLYGVYQDLAISQRCLYEIERGCDMKNMFEYLDCYGGEKWTKMKKSFKVEKIVIS